MALARCVLALVVPLVLLSACGGSATLEPTSEPVAQVEPTPTAAAPEPEPDPTATMTPEATPTPDPAGLEALAVVEAFDPVDETAAIGSLNELVFKDGEVNSASIVPSLAPLLSADDPDRRWAALYVVALVTDTPEEIEILMTVLDDPELTFRVQAAGSLAGLGVVESLPVLIEGLGSDAQLPFDKPGAMVADHARVTLEHYTGQSFPDVAGWQSWWERVEDSIEWDGERYAGS